MSTVILSCESLEVYVAAAQKMAGTTYPVIWLKQKYHEEPAVMRSHILETIAVQVPTNHLRKEQQTVHHEYVHSQPNQYPMSLKPLLI